MCVCVWLGGVARADKRLVTAGLDGTLRSWQYAAQSGLSLTGRRAMHAGVTCVDYTSSVLAVGTDTGVAYLLHPDTAFDGPDYPPVRLPSPQPYPNPNLS